MKMDLQAQLISLSHHLSFGKMMGLRYQEITTIGTLEYSTRSKQCGQWLNSSEDRKCVAGIKTLTNIGEVGHSLQGGRCFLHLHLYLSTKKLVKTKHE